MKVRLPTGGALFVASDPTRDAPGECSQAFHLLPLIAAYLASTQCLLKMLELVRPLATVVKALNRTPAAMPFLRAAEQLAPCELAMSSAGMLTFVGDVLCVLTQALNCVVEQAKPVVELLTNLDSQIKSAEALGNAELVAALETEKNNLKIRVAGLFESVEPIGIVLGMTNPLIAAVTIAPLALVRSQNSYTQRINDLGNQS